MATHLLRMCVYIGMGYSNSQADEEATQPEPLGKGPCCLWKLPILRLLPGSEGT